MFGDTIVLKSKEVSVIGIQRKRQVEGEIFDEPRALLFWRLSTPALQVSVQPYSGGEYFVYVQRKLT